MAMLKLSLSLELTLAQWYSVHILPEYSLGYTLILSWSSKWPVLGTSCLSPPSTFPGHKAILGCFPFLLLQPSVTTSCTKGYWLLPSLQGCYKKDQLVDRV
jgi:hypothetical protein